MCVRIYLVSEVSWLYPNVSIFLFQHSWSPLVYLYGCIYGPLHLSRCIRFWPTLVSGERLMVYGNHRFKVISEAGLKEPDWVHKIVGDREATQIETNLRWSCFAYFERNNSSETIKTIQWRSQNSESNAHQGETIGISSDSLKLHPFSK